MEIWFTQTQIRFPLSSPFLLASSSSLLFLSKKISENSAHTHENEKNGKNQNAFRYPHPKHEPSWLLFRKQRKEDGQDRHKKKDKEIEHERQTDIKDEGNEYERQTDIKKIKEMNTKDKQTWKER